METPNFFKRNKEKLTSAVVGAGIMMGAMGANAQEQAPKVNYESMPNPLTASIDLDEIDAFQEAYPLEIPKVQNEWADLNRTYYLDGFRIAQRESFNSGDIKVPEGLTLEQTLYYLEGIEKGYDKWLAEGNSEETRDYSGPHKLTEKEKRAKTREAQKKMKGELNSRAGTCGVGKAQRKNLKNYY